MALLPTWEYQNYKNTVRNESTKEYKEMVNDIRDMLWPHRDKLRMLVTFIPMFRLLKV